MLRESGSLLWLGGLSHPPGTSVQLRQEEAGGECHTCIS